MCTGKTHALAGLAAGAAWSEFAQHGTWQHTVAFAGFTGALALWNDADQCGSTVSRSLGVFSNLVAMGIRKVSGGHRHLTHSLTGIAATWGLAWAAVLLLPYRPWSYGADAILAVLITFSVSGLLESLRLMKSTPADVTAIGVTIAVIWHGYGLALIPAAVLLGQLAHAFMDCLTDSGCPLLLPFTKFRFRFLPEPLAFTTQTAPETELVRPLLIGMLAVMAAWMIDPALDRAALAALEHLGSRYL